MMMEFWTMLRFMLYPVIFVFGLAWSVFFALAYRRGRCASDGWAFWLGAAATMAGAGGFLALLTAHRIGRFNSTTSALFTLGLVAVVVVLIAGSTEIWLTAWRASSEERRRLRCRLDDYDNG